MVFIKAANDILTDYTLILRTGVAFLQEDIRKAKEFDLENPDCKEKDVYFNRANYVCMFSLWQLGLYNLCEGYYAQLLGEIQKYERGDNHKIFNKGMVYANLGVSQIAQGKIDEGFANILKAQMEDEPCHKTNPSQSIFRNPLYTQFEDGKEGQEGIKDYILKHSRLYQTEESKTVDKVFLGNLISSLDTDSHILFISSVEKIRRNLIILADKDNQFTRLQIFLCLQGLCLAIENSLKMKNKSTGTLRELLDVLFSRASGRDRLWKPIFDANYGYATSDDASQLQTNLQGIFKGADNKARRLLVCCAFRNFSAHNLDVGNDCVFGKMKDDTILDNIISSILFLREQNCI